MGIYALAAKKLTAAVNGRLKAKPRKGAQRRTTAPLCAVAWFLQTGCGAP